MKKIQTYLFTLPSLLLILFSVLANDEIHTPEDDKLNWIRFMWVGDSLDNRYFDKAGINLPVRMQGIPHDFTFQFDLGADLTRTYGSSLHAYLHLYPEVQQKLDSSSGHTFLKNVDLVMDGQQFQDRDLFYMKGYGSKISLDSARSNTVKHIGTIGVDLFQNQVLIIDYPNTRLAVTQQLPTDIANKTTFVDISLDRHGRVHLPLLIQGEEKKLLFDTGASLFPLQTTPENWAIVTSQQVTDSILTSTWGKQYYMYGSTVDNIQLGNKELPTATCYKNEYLADFYKQEGIWGVTGNAYFWDHVVVIDFANKKFGIVN